MAELPELTDPTPTEAAWEVLTIATMRLATAAANWDDARRRYLATNPYHSVD